MVWEIKTGTTNLIYIGLLTHQQKQSGFFVSQDEDFIYLFRGKNGNAQIKAIFPYATATVKEIRDEAEKYRQELPKWSVPKKTTKEGKRAINIVLSVANR